MSIRLVRDRGIIRIFSPYNKDFIFAVKSIGGKWNANKRGWEVQSTCEKQLLKLLKKHYGYVEDGEEGSEKIEIEFRAQDFEWYDEIRVGGLTVAKRNNRDSAAYTVNGFYVSKGSSFPKSGGSSKNPSVDPEIDTYMRGLISVAVYEELSEEKKILISIIEK